MHINALNSTYAFPEIGISRLLVEERKNGQGKEVSLGYFHYMRFLLPPSPADSQNPRLYFPETQFAQQLDDLFLNLVHGEKCAQLLPPGERRPITNDDMVELATRKGTILKVDQQKNRLDSPYFKGSLCQAVESYLCLGFLPQGMTLHKISPWAEEAEDPFAYSLHIDLTK